MEISARNRIFSSFGVRNNGTVTFPGDEAFGGVIEIRNETGILLQRSEVMRIEQIRPSEMANPVQSSGSLQPGRYYLTWGAPGYGSTMVNFTIIEHDEVLAIGEETRKSIIDR